MTSTRTSSAGWILSPATATTASECSVGFGRRWRRRTRPASRAPASARPWRAPPTNGRIAVQSAGKAQPGDKTIVDALQPFASTFAAAVDRGDSTAGAWKEAAAAAAQGAERTASMVARVGRARPHGEKSVGTPDPGAISFVVVVKAVLPVLSEDSAVGEQTTEGRRA
ncbi:MAG: DAK2 domain-containing protein [Chloroflexi bacterium]|nr:MAG: DAK2 domain-containing protein [Chloroflexota bacterium]